MRRKAVGRILLTFLISSVLFMTLGWGQAPSAPPAPPQQHQNPDPKYVLGPKDTVSIWARQPAEVNGQNIAIDGAGFVNIPLIGRVQAAGMTTEEFERDLTDRLKTWVIEPQVIVNVVGYRAILVSVVGAVNEPGKHDLLKGSGTLLDVVQAAKPRPDASTVVRVMRRVERGSLPVASATPDPSGNYTVADINLRSIGEGYPEANIQLVEDDQITVNQSPLVYIAGDVVKQGSVTADPLLGGTTVLQALSQAGGFTRTADPKKARILRTIQVKDTQRQVEIPVDVAKIHTAKAQDVRLLPNDILFIPGSVSKQAAQKAVEAMISMGTNMLTWGLIRVRP